MASEQHTALETNHIEYITVRNMDTHDTSKNHGFAGEANDFDSAKDTSDFGFVRVAAAVPVVSIANPRKNAEKICGLMDKAEKRQVSIVTFPELSVTGYTCADLFGQEMLIAEAENAVAEIAAYSVGKNVTAVVGAPVGLDGRLYNCAVVIKAGKICGIVPKTYLPNYNEFYECRWFSSGSRFIKNPVEFTYAGQRVTMGTNSIFSVGKASFAIEICEDLWAPVAPSSFHSVAGALITLNLSASNEIIGKDSYRKQLVTLQSAKTYSAYIYCSAGYGESTQDLVYSGAALIAENGSLLAENGLFQTEDSIIVADIDCEKLETLRRKSSTYETIFSDGEICCGGQYKHIAIGDTAPTDFSKDLLHPVEAHPFIPKSTEKELDARCRSIIDIQVTGLVTRLNHIACKSAVVGISGGLDSTLALIVTVMAFDKAGLDRKNITGITMPGYGTTDRTYRNAIELMSRLGISIREIPIAGACDRHFADIGHDKNIHDTTYENSQARERTQILMDVANQVGGIVIGTGDLSELALGWATYNGDHISMYGVNASIPKTLVRYLVKWAAGQSLDTTCSIQNTAGCTRDTAVSTGDTDGSIGSATVSTGDADGSIGSATVSTGFHTVKEILLDIVDTPVSPELLPADKDGAISQVTEDLVGPYELHDFFLYNFFRFGFRPAKIQFLAEKAFHGSYDSDTINKWLKMFIRRFFTQQFKRSCLPDGPKVGSISLSPRGDWRMPSDTAPGIFNL